MAASIVVPGGPAIRRTPALGLLLFTLGFALPLVAVAWAVTQRDDLVGLALDSRFLTAVTVVGLAVVVARLLAIAEIAHAYRVARRIGAKTAVATLVVVAMGIPVLWLTFRANQARSVVANVFSEGGTPALYVPTGAPTGVTNILLLGGDAGPGRWGLRTDTMILVTIDNASGRAGLVSIPRNLTRLQFVPGSPLAAQFPNGFDDLANAVFPYVSTHDDLMTYYEREGLQPEAVALSEAIGYSLDVEIDDYALVNMQGFLELIDAVGGFTINLDDSVPLPPSIPGGKHAIPSSVGPGAVEMDGTLAIAYARSRSADSDYQRMGRQRQLLAALGSQVSASDAIGGFGTMAGVLDDSMRTSLSSSEFSDLLDTLGDSTAIVESVGLVPPLIEPGSPDYAQIRVIIDAVQQAVQSAQPSGY
jgi:LCP family protein required for cell wall assembly